MRKYKVSTHTLYIRYGSKEELERIIATVKYYFDVRTIRTYTAQSALKVTLRYDMDADEALELLEYMFHVKH